MELNNITKTKDMIFVFGSNLSGIHGAGAARYAAVHRGAQWGVGEGPTGASYAIPTKGLEISFMELPKVHKHILKFLQYAHRHDHINFQVTMVGCGLAGFKNEEIAPLFELAPDNCWFDTKWSEWLQEKKFWGTF